MERVMKNIFLFLAKNSTLAGAAQKYGLRFGASRFVAGETIDQAVTVVKGLNDKGLDVTLDYLGEFVDNEEEAAIRTDRVIAVLKAIHRENLHAQLSVKLTSLGLDCSDERTRKHLYRILDEAKEQQVFVTLDMEDFTRCEKTLAIFKELKQEYDQVGTVLQAYLYRSMADLEKLKEYHASLRLVKGAYKESVKVAFPEKKDVDENFKEMIKTHLLTGNFTAIATHDENIIEYTKQFVQANHIQREQFEFQMLYGIRPERQLELVNEGYRMRVYVPFGSDWYGYFMRRLAERPANAAFVVKSLFKK